MKPFFRSKALAFLLLLVTLASYAQTTDSLKTATWKGIASWKAIPSSSSTEVSPDGKWFAYLLARADEGDAALILQSTADSTRKTFKVGATTRADMAFSDNGRFFAYKVSPTEKEKKDKKKDEKLVLVSLMDFTKNKEFKQVKSYAFNGKKSSHLAVLLAPEEGTKPTDPKGTNLLLCDLQNQRTQNIGNVSEYAFNKPGTWLALTLDARNQAGNGILLQNMTTSVMLPLDTDEASYESLKWMEDGDGLALVKGKKDKKYKEKLYSVLGIKGFAGTPAAGTPAAGTPALTTYDPKIDSLNFPQGMTVSPNRDPTWTDDLTRLLFGIHKTALADTTKKKDSNENPNEISEADQLARIKADTTLKTVEQITKAIAKIKGEAKDKDKPEKPDMTIWNWQDKRLQSRQQVQEAQDKKFSFLAMYDPATQKFTQLADSTLRDVSPAPKQRYALGTDIQPYELMTNLDGQDYADLYLTDLKTGERTRIMENFYLPSRDARPQPAPDGTKFLYWQDGHFFVFDMEKKTSRNISENVPTSFIDEEDDHNVQKPPYPNFGWSSDSEYMLLSDGWDVWQVAAEEAGDTKPRKKSALLPYRNLTQNGKRDKIRYENRYQLDPDEKGIDLSQPLYVRTYGDWTKKSGVTRLDATSGEAKILLWDNAAVRNLTKAKNADYYVYSSESFTKPTQYYGTSSKDLAEGKQISENAPDFNKYAWSAGTRLVDYVSDKGDTLQGALFLPAGYVEGQKYPTLVYYYEKLSQTLHNFANPSYGRTGWNPGMYTANGYAVFIPDIVYRYNDPGMSAVWCVLPGVQAAIATGVVDGAKMGIHGHSWGGYQTAFLITQTNQFKAAAAGAPLTDMISMYNLIYWNSGGANGSIFEASQGRLGTPWDNWEAYQRNSPIYHAKKVQTPLLMLHNDKDGAVDFTQGIEYFNALRRLKKPVTLIQYKGENHGLAKLPNRKDYSVRMMEFFDHHLKGKPAPLWWSEGVPKLELDEHLEEKAFR